MGRVPSFILDFVFETVFGTTGEAAILLYRWIYQKAENGCQTKPVTRGRTKTSSSYSRSNKNQLPLLPSHDASARGHARQKDAMSHPHSPVGTDGSYGSQEDGDLHAKKLASVKPLRYGMVWYGTYACTVFLLTVVCQVFGDHGTGSLECFKMQSQRGRKRYITTFDFCPRLGGESHQQL